MLKVKWPKVIDTKNGTPILKWIDLGNATMFRISSFYCHGGREFPCSGLQVSLERVGSFFFKLHRESIWFRWDYVAEKLFLPQADARNMADWINAQLGFVDAEQQGEYKSEYINECEPYGLAGE